MISLIDGNNLSIKDLLTDPAFALINTRYRVKVRSSTVHHITVLAEVTG
jgi:hypothetical protein